MKKIIISSCFLLLTSFLDNQLNLRFSVEAKGLSYIEKNEIIADLTLDKSKLDSKIAQIKNQILTLILINCTLQEKLQLKGFTKHSDLFKKLLSELVINGATEMGIELKDIQAFAISINLTNFDIKQLKNNQNITSNSIDQITRIQGLTEKLVATCETNLCTAIQRIAKFFNPAFNEAIQKDSIQKILATILKTLNPEELKTLEDITSKSAFTKIVNSLDEIAEITIRILSEK